MTPDGADMTPETLAIACAICRKDINTVWTKHGMRRGDYVLAGELIFHPACWEEQVEIYNKMKAAEPAPTREELILDQYSTPGLKRNVLPSKLSVTHTELPKDKGTPSEVDCPTCNGLGYIRTRE